MGRKLNRSSKKGIEKKRIERKVKETFVDDLVIENGRWKVGIIYPNTYYLGMSNLGFQGIYYHFVKGRDFHVNRYFYDIEEEKRVYSPEGEFGLSQAKVILVSQSYENDFFLLAEMLGLNGIEPLSEFRDGPLVLVGGAFSNSNPKFFLSLADVVFKGEYENYIQELIGICGEDFKGKAGFMDLAVGLIGDKYMEYEGKKEGGGGCSVGGEGKFFVVKDSPLFWKGLEVPNYTHILTEETSFSNNFLVEITRGCRFRCRFCNVPGLYGNLRVFKKEGLFEVFDLGLRRTNRIGLVSALTTQYPDLKELIYYVNERGGKVSFSSLRVEQVDDELIQLIRDNGQKILTIAPEAGSEKIKRKIKKSIKKDRVYGLVERAIELGFKKLKFYFIIGYEDEGLEDLDEMIEFVRYMRGLALKYTKRLKYMPQMILGINQLIPKPKTPFSEEVFLDYKSMKKRIRYLKRNLLNLGNIEMRIDNYQENYLQWRLAHGGEELGKRIIGWTREGLLKSEIYSRLYRGG